MTITKKTLPVKASSTQAKESDYMTPERSKSPSNNEGNKKKPLPPLSVAERKIGPTTKIIIQYDVGFSNLIYVRGKGATLSWEKGIPLKNTKDNEWIWETTTPFTTCEFKVLINDKEYEIGDNHLLSCGASIHYTPKFH